MDLSIDMKHKAQRKNPWNDWSMEPILLYQIMMIPDRKKVLDTPRLYSE